MRREAPGSLVGRSSGSARDDGLDEAPRIKKPFPKRKAKIRNCSEKKVRVKPNQTSKSGKEPFKRTSSMSICAVARASL